MPSEKFTQLPTVANASLSDIICAVQSGTSVQETLSQVQSLMLSNTILTYSGNPNGNLAGSVYQLCWDSLDKILYICTTTGSSSTAVWEKSSLNTLVLPSQGGTGISNPTAHSIPVAEGSSNFNFVSLSNGELLIGNTGNDPSTATLTAGANISITNGSGTIQIDTTGSASFTWNFVSGTSQDLLPNNGYVVDNASLVTLTLPTSAALFSEIKIVGMGAGGWTVAQNSGQTINAGSEPTTTGVLGSLSSTNRYDSVSLICNVQDTEWTYSNGPQGLIETL